MKLVLASASPRRRALLAARGLTFDVIPSAAEEHVDFSLDASAAAAGLARDKARVVARRLAQPVHVLGADTMVVLGEEGEALTPERVLDKPTGPERALWTLRQLSGSRHRVITGLCVVSPSGGEHLASETTWVTMRTWTETEIEAYVASDEWRDKAGGYAIQESADRFVTQLEGGGFDNVVGLPVERALVLLAQAGWFAS